MKQTETLGRSAQPALQPQPRAGTTARQRSPESAPTRPQLRSGLSLRFGLLIAGLFLFAAGIVALLKSGLGLSPWDVLHQGIARHTPLSFGEANITVGIVVLAAAFLLGARIGIGTITNAILVGGFVQLLTPLGPVAGLAHDTLGTRVSRARRLSVVCHISVKDESLSSKRGAGSASRFRPRPPGADSIAAAVQICRCGLQRAAP